MCTLLNRRIHVVVFSSKDRSNDIGEWLLHGLLFLSLLLLKGTLSTKRTIFIHFTDRHIFLLNKWGAYLLKYNPWLNLWRLRRWWAIIDCWHCCWWSWVNLQSLPYVLLQGQETLVEFYAVLILLLLLLLLWESTI
jgi:hypothetical protein